MRSYYRIMLGRESVHAKECFTGGFVGTDFGINEDLTRKLPEQLRDFNKQFIPLYLQGRPDKTKISAGLACGALWTVSKGIKKGDIVMCPDGGGYYRFGEVVGDYYYQPGEILFHRRKVRWLDVTVARSALSEALKNSSGSKSTYSNISEHGAEIEKIISNSVASGLNVLGDTEIEDPVAFAMEQHLEEFLIANWGQTFLAKDFDIYEEDGELVGQQYATDAGYIDILAISKDKKKLLVLELKRGRASDVVVGQVLRYMGFVKEQIAEDDQQVEGAIIALEDDQKLKWAIAAVPQISFYRYQISFKLVRG